MKWKYAFSLYAAETKGRLKIIERGGQICISERFEV